MAHEPRCPGCSKHCPASQVRCKYGRKYFEQHPVSEASPPRKMKKWEKRVASGGPLWQLLTTAKIIKKQLKARPEEELLIPLSPEEQARLIQLLKKISDK